jgi:hypothetical protein
LRPTRVSPVAERLADGRRWLRVADPDWSDPLDPTFAGRSGGRWNPPGSFPVLYLNEDVRTARANLAAFVAGWPYELEDLRADRAPCLAVARLPRSQFVADAHSPAGLRALGLPRTYPLDATGALVPKERCQPLGSAVEAAGLKKRIKKKSKEKKRKSKCNKKLKKEKYKRVKSKIKIEIRKNKS